MIQLDPDVLVEFGDYGRIRIIQLDPDVLVEFGYHGRIRMIYLDPVVLVEFGDYGRTRMIYLDPESLVGSWSSFEKSSDPVSKLFYYDYYPLRSFDIGNIQTTNNKVSNLKKKKKNG